jgi:hypothetical protein
MDLSSMFQNLGPAGGAMLTGMQARDAAAEQASQDAYRKAQMEEIMQRTQSARETAPLDLQLKQQSVKLGDLNFESGQTKLAKDKLDLETGQMEAGIKRIDNYTNLMQVAAAQLSNVPPPARHAWLAQFAKDNKIDVNNPAVQSIWQQTSQIRPELLPQAIEGFVKKLALTKASHLQKIAEINAQGQNQVTLESMRESAKAKLQAEKGNLEKSIQQDLSGAKTFQAQAVVFSNHAAKARLRGDTEEANRLDALAKEATIRDLQARSAAGDAQAAQKLQALQMVMGGGVTPTPATPISGAPAASSGAPVTGTTKSGAKFTITPTP